MQTQCPEPQICFSNCSQDNTKRFLAPLQKSERIFQNLLRFVPVNPWGFVDYVPRALGIAPLFFLLYVYIYICIHIYIYIYICICNRIFARASRALIRSLAHDIGQYQVIIWFTCSNTLGSTFHNSKKDDTFTFIQYGGKQTASPCTITDVIAYKAHARKHKSKNEKKILPFT